MTNRDRQRLEAGPAPGPLEIWGGIECTVARIGDRYRDQVVETGHRDRAGDLDLVAGLGLKTLRYPILWETVAPDRPAACDFSWHDERLGRLRELGIEPVAGLVHHGSGPRYTDLLDPAFPRLFANYAGRVARRYPWITRWTPLNEPLTTARFSCLYGHWYPHRRSEADCLRALVNQCRAVLLAMQAIRRTVPGAELIQTEDLGRVFSTPALAYQAAHENERRWLTFDLLFGRVDQHHPWRGRFLAAGVAARDLDALADGEARPALVGINHYLTSDRFLDERFERYPAHLAGGNGRDRYADVEAVRIADLDGEVGSGARLAEAWSRYGTPLAVTEAHHGSSRDEQLRWLAQVCREADGVRRQGVDVRAVTVWSLFGTVDWNSLLTRDIGLYEPGAFDIRGEAPRPTALAGAIRDLARTGTFDHPVLDVPGWWQRGERAYAGDRASAAAPGVDRPRRILLTGCDGPMRRAVVRVAGARGLALATGTDLPVSLRASGIWAAVASLPASGENSPALRALASACGAESVPLMLLCPEISEADRAVRLDIRRRCPTVLEIEAGHAFSPFEPDGIVASVLRDAAFGHLPEPGGDRLALSYLPDLAHVALDLFLDGACGSRLLVNGRARLADLASWLCSHMAGGVSSAEEAGAIEDDPTRTMPPLASALGRYLAEAEPGQLDAAGPHRIAAE